MTAFVIADLGFGDSGKGTITEYLVRKHDVKLVVRYNGGAQAGHTVVTDEGRHRTFTFAQFGSGTLAGARTHLSRFMVVHPTGMLVEAERLGMSLDPISIDPRARVITPFHQIAGQERERRERHGSCGIGVGETVRDSIEHPDETITVADLARGDLRAKLERVRERKRIDDAGVSDRWIEALARFRPALVEDERAIPKNGEDVVFEGAHGVLLDEWRGFHPHTTWHTCTFEHALELLAGHSEPIRRIGVLRTYFTRHGPGPLPTEDPELQSLEEPHNPTGEWQGAFRRGWFDAALARYAIAACGGIDGLAITHVDRIRRPGWKIADYALSFSPSATKTLTPASVLAGVRPSYDEPADFLARIEAALGVRIAIRSHGPRASDKME